MKISTTFIALVVGGAGLAAAKSHGGHSVARHSRVSRQLEPVPAKNSLGKRCKVRPGKTTENVATSTASPKVTVAAAQASSKADDAPVQKPATLKAAVAPDNKKAANSAVINVKTTCGDIRASPTTTSVTGPNGHIDWLNCGISDSGWRPPFVTIDQLKTESLTGSLGSAGSPFHVCAQFVPLFEKYGGQFGIPSIMLASFALQESSCNPDTVGGAGEQGLMQLTKDKCGAAPGGNCKEPDFNIRTGAKFFADTLASNGGDVIKSIGTYNGWSDGLTISEATAAAKGACCRCQNNLDYIHQFVNGWLQGINAYDTSLRLGRYFNLDTCNK